MKALARSLLNGIKRLDSVIEWTEGWLVCLILAEMILLAFAQVILRNIFSFGYAWIEELLRVSVLWVGFLGASLAIKQERHINIDVLSRTIPEQYKPVLKTIINLVLFGVCLTLLLASVEYIRVEKEFGEISDQLHAPVWILQLIFPFLFGLGCFRFTVQTIESLISIPARWRQ